MEDNQKLATELLHLIKTSAKRWFIIALVELVVILGIIVGMIWYNSLPVEEYTDTQTVEDIEGSVISQNIGGK